MDYLRALLKNTEDAQNDCFVNYPSGTTVKHVHFYTVNESSTKGLLIKLVGKAPYHIYPIFYETEVKLGLPQQLANWRYPGTTFHGCRKL